MDIDLVIKFVSAMIAILSTLILLFTIRSNRVLQQNSLFNEVIKQERELRIKLSEYRDEIQKNINKPFDMHTLTLDYDTLLFNYYEYLAICVYKKLIDRKCAKIYFRTLLKNMKDLFDESELFEENFADKKDYPGIQWLFKYWDIK